MELVSCPLTISVNDNSHSTQHGVYEMVEEFYIKASSCHACRTLFHNSFGLLGSPWQLEYKVLFIFAHTCISGSNQVILEVTPRGRYHTSYRTTFDPGGHSVPDGYPAGTQLFLQDNAFGQKGQIHSLISLDRQPW